MSQELTLGSHGDDVKALQVVLHELGYIEVGTPDRSFGDNTISAVIRFQSEHGLEVTGVVDDMSRAVIVATATNNGIAHLCPELVSDASAFAYGHAPAHHADESGEQGHAAAQPAGGAGHIPDGATRSEDGNWWWDGAEWQPVHSDVAAVPGTSHGVGHVTQAAMNDYIDLLQGFVDLAVAAVHDGGKTLDSVHLGADLGAAHHTLLEHVRATLIDAQADHAARQRAAHAWPGLAAQLQAAAGEARAAGVKEESVATFTEYAAAIGEGYIHAAIHGGGTDDTVGGADWVEFVTGVQDILATVYPVHWDWTSGVLPTNLNETNATQQAALHGLAFGGHVSEDHGELLESARKAFILARTQGSARAALVQWQAALPTLRHALARAPEFVNADLSWINSTVGEMDEKLFHQGVIAEAEHGAHATLQTPDLPLQIKKLEEAAEGFEEIDKLLEKTADLTKESVITAFVSKGTMKPELVHAIFEIVKSPGEIYEKLEQFQKQGVIDKAITVADMADKVLSVRNAVMEVAFETVKSYATAQAEKAAASGFVEVAEKWAKSAEWAEDKIKVLEKVKTAATVITLAVSAIKVIDALAKGDWAGALKEAANTGLGIAVGAAAGTAGTVMLAGVTLVVAAEMEGISGAAAMIRYAHASNEREAALSFIDLCTTAMQIEAQGLVDDVEILKDPANAGETQRIQTKLDSHAQYWQRHLHQLAEQFHDTAESSIGGQLELRAALGTDAAAVLDSPDAVASLTGMPRWESMARQIQVIFAGANAMTRAFVDKHAEN